MLYVQDKVVKLGGVYLKGQVTSVEVQEAGSVYVAQDEKGRFKKSQPHLQEGHIREQTDSLLGAVGS